MQIKVVVITDNDTDFVHNIQENYQEYNNIEKIKICADDDDKFYTFECCIYRDNQAICDSLFQTPHRQLSTIDYMLKNKADAAFKLTLEKAADVVAPSYIKEALEWINA